MVNDSGSVLLLFIIIGSLMFFGVLICGTRAAEYFKLEERWKAYLEKNRPQEIQPL
jgi:hypothetical protein